jgi:Complex I intermediate-associated protein 30 (CIA30)
MTCRNCFPPLLVARVGVNLRTYRCSCQALEASAGTSHGTIYTLFVEYSDQVMGGISEGTLTREVVQGRNANVLRGTVRLENNGGFIQMATNLAASSGVSSSGFLSSSAVPVDASHFEGVELDVLSLSSASETFNLQYVVI